VAAAIAPPQKEASQVTGAPESSSAMAIVPKIQTATVEKGNNLWRISRETLGQGVRYTEIYAANATQIRDPKLIYPGQVFVIPGELN
jgi:nucleoid-associated protein YgaU